MAEGQVILDTCSTCPRRELDLRFRPDADRTIGHIVMDGVFATDALRIDKMRCFIHNQVLDGIISQREANLARNCAMAQQEGSCSHYQEDIGDVQ